MMELTTTPQVLKEANTPLMHYYDIKGDELKFDLQTTAFAGPDYLRLSTAYRKMTPSDREEEILTTLLALVLVVRNRNNTLFEQSAVQRSKSMRRRDLLRLLVLCETTKSEDTIIIKNRIRSFQLDNEANWFIKSVIRTGIIKELGNDVTLEMAEKELDKASDRHRGRMAKNPQMLDIIWGTYRYLSDTHRFKTPMPNAMCSFIITLLQVMGFLSENTEIDVYWIRSQLRYMSTRKTLNPA